MTTNKLIPFGNTMITQHELDNLRKQVKLIHEQCVREEYWDKVQEEEMEKAYSTGVDTHMPDRDSVRKDEEDEEAILNLMVNKQDQMAPVWDMIQDMNKNRNTLFTRYGHHKAAYMACMSELNMVKAKYNNLHPQVKTQKAQAFFQWQRKLWDRANPIKDKRDAAWAACEQILDKDGFYQARLSLLWKIWKQMLSECNEIVGHRTYLWPKYFELKEGALDPRHITANPEEIDNSIVLRQDKETLWNEVVPGVLYKVQGYTRDFSDTLEDEFMADKALNKLNNMDSHESTGSLYKEKAWKWEHREDPRVQGIKLNPKTLQPYSGEEETAQFMDEMDTWTYQDEDMPHIGVYLSLNWE